MKQKRPNAKAVLLDREGLIHPRVASWVDRNSHSILLESTRRDRQNVRTYLFETPVQIISCKSLGEVEQCLSDIDRAVKDGLYAAGYMTYEAGYAFEPVFHSIKRLPNPLLWFGIFEEPLVYNHASARVESGKRTLEALLPDNGSDSPAREVSATNSSISETEYRDSFQRIKQYLVEGDTYQVNYTLKLLFRVDGSASSLYTLLRNRQRVGYAAFLNTGTERILSFSPEMFLKRQGSLVTLKPMKGTAPRGRTNEEDDNQIAFLRSSEKNKAENLMIVDLLRNDVGRIAASGSVRVSKFFEMEKYETVFQATSTITARLKHKIGVPDIVRALFPSGSVTGAPKIRTMQIINELEKEPRGVYTGAIGFWAPRRKARFNVAIRTVVIGKDGGGEMGIGSGVVNDSEVESEHQECLLKGRFLTDPVPEFKLIETMKWEKESGWLLVEHHIRRLKSSGHYFDFRVDEKKIRRELKDLEKVFRREYEPDDIVRVRLTVNRIGGTEVSHRRLEPLHGVQKAILSDTRTDSRNRFFFHKTTNRELYDRELEQFKTLGYFDVIHLNERDEVTEGARSNVVILLDGILYTPPIECGVLPGTFRAHLLEQSKIKERVLKLEDLRSAQTIYLCNAVYGLVEVKLETTQTNEGNTHAQPLAVEN